VHFCCKMYRLATSRARKETSRRKRERFLRHGQPCITYWYSVVVALEWIEFGCFIKYTRLNRIARLVIRRSQYDRLSQQQLSCYPSQRLIGLLSPIKDSSFIRSASANCAYRVTLALSAKAFSVNAPAVWNSLWLNCT